MEDWFKYKVGERACNCDMLVLKLVDLSTGRMSALDHDGSSALIQSVAAKPMISDKCALDRLAFAVIAHF